VTWSTRFRLRQRLKSSLWAWPLVAGILGALLGDLGRQLDQVFDLPAYWTYSPETAISVLSAIVGSMIALTGFALTVSVLGVQMATGTFSARYMRILYRDPSQKWLLTVLVGTTTFAFALLRRIETQDVPNVGITVAGALVLVSLISFLIFLDRFLHRLRPVAVAAHVARAGRRAFERGLAAVPAEERPDILPPGYDPGEKPARLVRSTRAGAIQAIDGPGLVRFAKAHRCRLMLRHSIGDFVPEAAVLVEVYGEDPGETCERSVGGMIALGVERTIDQDPAFAIRIMVDVAIRALSPAVNDPTTAVQVLNHLGETLRFVGSTPAPVAPREPATAGVLVPIQRWEQFLSLSVTEIRQFGGSSVQVARRLRSVLEELRESVVPERRGAVDAELARLDATVAAHFGGAIDLDLASATDRQGIGGPVS